MQPDRLSIRTVLTGAALTVAAGCGAYVAQRAGIAAPVVTAVLGLAVLGSAGAAIVALMAPVADTRAIPVPVRVHRRR
ncbi:hypothetical protein [Paenirhodobacter enshiensis]|uniref:hypothetical protein n=1 Tax=Paenirhodobacter enshiensis TaxID=1105367 RepID=UPI0035B0DB61